MRTLCRTTGIARSPTQARDVETPLTRRDGRTELRLVESCTDACDASFRPCSASDAQAGDPNIDTSSLGGRTHTGENRIQGGENRIQGGELLERGAASGSLRPCARRAASEL